MAAPSLRLNSASVRFQCFPQLFVHLNLNQPFPSSPISTSFPFPNCTSASTALRPILCRAAKSPTDPVDKRSSSTSSRKKSNNNNKNNKKKKSNSGSDDSKSLNLNDVEIADDFAVHDDGAPSILSSSVPHLATPLPKPPAGFVVDERGGKVLLSSQNRLATIVDPTNNLPLECVIRREFTSSQGDECKLLCPVDMPVQILKTTNANEWLEVNYEEFESILPAASYALAKIHLHLVYSGYCYTARGSFCYSEEDIFDFHPEGKEVDGLPTEGVQITCFNLEGTHYMVYTPSDPLLFVAIKDQNGMLQIVNDHKNQNQTETKRGAARISLFKE